MGVAIASTCNSADQSEGRVIGHAQCPLTKWERWKENMWGNDKLCDFDKEQNII